MIVLVAGSVHQLINMLAVRIQDYSLLRSFLLCKDHFIDGIGLLKSLIEMYRLFESIINLNKLIYLYLVMIKLI